MVFFGIVFLIKMLGAYPLPAHAREKAREAEQRPCLRTHEKTDAHMYLSKFWIRLEHLASKDRKWVGT